MFNKVCPAHTINFYGITVKDSFKSLQQDYKTCPCGLVPTFIIVVFVIGVTNFLQKQKLCNKYGHNVPFREAIDIQTVISVGLYSTVQTSHNHEHSLTPQILLKRDIL